MGKRYVLYHGNCYDGFGAAWAAREWAGPDGVFIPCLYGNPIPEIEAGSDVAIVDFSFPRDVLFKLDQHVNSLIVLDHHKTAQADLAGLPFAYFEMEMSGAMMSWNHFHPESEAPLLIEYIQDRDLWRFSLPESRQVHAALRSYPFDFEVWDRLEIDNLRKEGEILLRAADQQVQRMCDGGVVFQDFKLAGVNKIPCVNATVHFSEVGDELCKRYPLAPFAAYYLDRGDGKRQFGLYSHGDFDVSAVAKVYAGGGHKNAAGFVTGAPDLMGIITTGSQNG